MQWVFSTQMVIDYQPGMVEYLKQLGWWLVLAYCSFHALMLIPKQWLVAIIPAQRRTACQIQYGRQGPKMGERVWKGFYPQVFGHPCQLFLNEFFDQSTPSMRKVDDGEKEKKKKKKEKQAGAELCQAQTSLNWLPTCSDYKIAIFTSCSTFCCG